MTPPRGQGRRIAADALARLAVAVQFETRLPVPARGWQAGELSRALGFFPLAGAIAGLIAALVWWAASGGLPASVAAGLALAALLAIGGALHEDGLADTVDALGGQSDRERALEILRDSRIGTYGVLALVFSVGLRWAALATLSTGSGALALVVAPAIGRAAMVPAIALAGPARHDGLGASLGAGPGGNEIALALVTAVLLAVLVGGVGLLAALFGVVAGLAVFGLAVRRLGGYTGDILGAVSAVAETVAFVTLAAAR